jgi:DNA-binding NarL/FixJ family response regulator
MAPDDSQVLQQQPSRIIIVDDHPLFRSAISHTLAGHSMPSFTSDSPLVESEGPQPDHTLTLREIEVLRLVVEGQTNQQIAKNLLMSVSTVKRHLRHISAKLEVCDRVQAAVRAIVSLLGDQPGAGRHQLRH